MDFENVGTAGIEQANGLGSSDYVHLFSTKNASKISTALLSKFNKTNLMVHEVPVRSQSVDMHLVSYLGYLLGTQGSSSTYVVVSKDTDFDAVIEFWKKEGSVDVRRQPGIRMAEKDAKRDKSPNKTPAPAAKKPKNGGEAPHALAKRAASSMVKRTSTPQERVRLNAAVMRALVGIERTNEEKGKIASAVVRILENENRKQAIYRDLVSRLGQETGSGVYRQIKALL